jgi:hypothetical protein
MQENLNKKQWLDNIKQSINKQTVNENKNNGQKPPEDITFEIFRKLKFAEDVSELTELCEMNYYTELGSYNKKLSKPVVFFKRLVRRMLKFLFIPAFNKQSAFNYNSAKYIRVLLKENLELQRRIEVLEKKINNI